MIKTCNLVRNGGTMSTWANAILPSITTLTQIGEGGILIVPYIDLYTLLLF